MKGDAPRTEAERAIQDSCRHQKRDGRTAWGGQVNGDGKIRFMCIQCNEVLPAVVAPDQWKTGGVNSHLDDDGSGGMNSITRKDILGWHVGTIKECADPGCKAKEQHETYRKSLLQPVGA